MCCTGLYAIYGYCQAGFSADITQDGVIMGKVGWSWPYKNAKEKSIQWAGKLDYAEHAEKVTFLKERDKREMSPSTLRPLLSFCLTTLPYKC
jgi:hypothetical protein